MGIYASAVFKTGFFIQLHERNYYSSNEFKNRRAVAQYDIPENKFIAKLLLNFISLVRVY